jgi:hypothetical protein
VCRLLRGVKEKRHKRRFIRSKIFLLNDILLHFFAKFHSVKKDLYMAVFVVTVSHGQGQNQVL